VILMKKHIFVMFLLAAAIGCKDNTTSTPTPVTDAGTTDTGAGARAMATIAPTGFTDDAGMAHGASGRVEFAQSGTQVTATVTLTGCPAGQHGIHLHQNPSCDMMGTAAGDHWNPESMTHGHLDHTPMAHLGDMGNVTCDASGNGALTFTTTRWTVGTGAANDVANHAVVVHLNADDLMTNPSGNSGGRIACGVISR
jgi:Cu-Zn family superoxide dismutase